MEGFLDEHVGLLAHRKAWRPVDNSIAYSITRCISCSSLFGWEKADTLQQTYAPFENGIRWRLRCGIDPLSKVGAVVSHLFERECSTLIRDRTCTLIKPIFDLPIVQKAMTIIICRQSFRLLMPTGSIWKRDLVGEKCYKHRCISKLPQIQLCLS